MANKGSINGDQQKDTVRSVAVEDIISRPPHALLRWGVTSIFIIALLVISASWIVKYPEIVSGEATLRTENPSMTYYANTDGYVEDLTLSHGAKIDSGQVIMSVSNTLSQEEYEVLIQWEQSLISELQSTSAQLIMSPDTIRSYGSVQQAVNQLNKSYIDWYTFNKRSIDSLRLSNLQDQVSSYIRLSKISHSKASLAQQEMENAKEKYLADKQLYEENIIARMTFLAEESKYHTRLQALESAKQFEVQTKLTLAETQMQMAELRFSYLEEKRQLQRNFQNALAQLRSQLDSWQLQYLIKSDNFGRLNYLQDLENGTRVRIGMPLVSIVPHQQNFYATALIPAANSGKLNRGQDVNLKLLSYNWQEYGMLRGTLEEISDIPNNGFYRIRIKLDNKEIPTSLKENLKPEMSAQCEVLTNQLTLLERIFHQVRKMMEPK